MHQQTGRGPGTLIKEGCMEAISSFFEEYFCCFRPRRRTPVTYGTNSGTVTRVDTISSLVLKGEKSEIAQTQQVFTSEITEPLLNKSTDIQPPLVAILEDQETQSQSAATKTDTVGYTILSGEQTSVAIERQQKLMVDEMDSLMRVNCESFPFYSTSEVQQTPHNSPRSPTTPSFSSVPFPRSESFVPPHILKEQLKSKNLENGKLYDQLNLLKLELAELENQSSIKQQAKDKELEKEKLLREQLEQELRAAQAQLKMKTIHTSSTIIIDSGEVMEKQKTIDVLRKRISELTPEPTSIPESPSLKKNNNELNEKNDQIKELEQRISSQREQIELLLKKLEKEKNHFKRSQRSDNERFKHEDHLEEREKQLVETEEEISINIEKLQKQLLSDHNLINRLIQEKNEYLLKLEKDNDEISSLKTKLDDLSKQIELNNYEIVDLNQKLVQAAQILQENHLLDKPILMKSQTVPNMHHRKEF